MSRRDALLFLASPSRSPCGIEMFTRALCRAVGERGRPVRRLDVAGGWRDALAIWRALGEAEALALSLPVVAWKRALALPLLALLFARLRGVESIVVLHEWRDLQPARRVFVALYLVVASKILFSAPDVREAWARSPLGRVSRSGGLIPIPPNIAPPALRVRSALLERIEAERAAGAIILGHFGSLYPKKQSTFALDVAARLRGEGRRVFALFVGDFISGADDCKARFLAHAAALDLEANFAVSGYVKDEAEIFALFDSVDVFVYCFADGLTSRRGSVLACLQSGRPLVVNAPLRDDEFDHHPTFRRLIEEGALRFAQPDPEAFAEAVLRAERAATPAGDLFAQAWRDAAGAFCAALRARPIRRAAASVLPAPRM